LDGATTQLMPFCIVFDRAHLAARRLGLFYQVEELGQKMSQSGLAHSF